MKYITILFIVLLTLPVLAVENIAQHLQDVSVTIKSNRGSGSGIIVTREVQISEDDHTKQKVNFILTAGHARRGDPGMPILIEAFPWQATRSVSTRRTIGRTWSWLERFCSAGISINQEPISIAHLRLIRTMRISSYTAVGF